MPPDMVLLFLGLFSLGSAQKFKAGRGYCIKFNEREYDMKVEYFDKSGKPTRGSERVLEGYTARLSCTGGRIIEPGELDCKCFNIRYRGSPTKLCVFKYLVNGVGEVGFLRNRGYCVHQSCSPINNPLLKGSYACDKYLKTQERGESRYPIDTQCNIQCDANFPTSTNADYAKCECNTDNQRGRTTRSTCIFHYFSSSNELLKNAGFECKDTMCAPQPIQNGEIESTCLNPKGMIDEGSRCKYVCESGYATSTDVTAVCACEKGSKCEVEHEGMFTFETKTKLCVQDGKAQPVCPSLTAFSASNQMIKCASDKNVNGAVCQFHCKTGYQPVSGGATRVNVECECEKDACFWHGFREKLECEPSDPCKNNPCGDGGTCTRNPYISHDYKCSCQAGYVYRLNKCEAATCENLHDRMIMDNIGRIMCSSSRGKKSTQFELDSMDRSIGQGTICWPKCKDGYDQKHTAETKKQYECRCKTDGRCQWSGTHPDKGHMEDFNCVPYGML